MAARQNPPPSANGFLNLYKPAGITSMEALRRVKRATGQRKKVGHAGTLDPLAEGILPICFGQATRFMELVVSGRKRYRMVVRLGEVSTTYDAEGEITSVASPMTLTRGDVAAALVGFVGTIEQVPPMYSAIKVDGRRLYDLARSGKEVERKPRTVEIYSIAIDSIDLPHLGLTVDCGRGTYLRSIAHDLGEMLGCGGYVVDLARVSCGRFTAQDALTLQDLEGAAVGGRWRDCLHPVDWALLDCEPLLVTLDEERAIGNGQAIPADGSAATPERRQARAYNRDGVFLALMEYRAGTQMWQPTRVFQPSDPSPYAPVRVQGRDWASAGLHR